MAKDEKKQEESVKPDNPYAFPGELLKPIAGRGMTLRDYLAAAALNGIISFAMGNFTPGQAAKKAYEYADAALVERGKS